MVWRKKTVLIVDDDENVRQLWRLALRAAGYLVKEASGGSQALLLIGTHRPDAVVLDLLMPGIDGFTVRKKLALDAHTRAVPIVVVTGATEDLETLNVSCVLRKPVLPEEVVSAVRRCLAAA